MKSLRTGFSREGGPRPASHRLWLLVFVTVFASATVAVAAWVSPKPAVEPATAGSGDAAGVQYNHLRVAVLGDAYAIGEGLPPRRGAWPAILRNRLCWTLSVTATTESGFAAQNQGSTSRTYLDGSGSAVLTSPDLVIVQGSSNDTDPDAVAAASAELFSELREKLPDASLIAIAPVSPPSRDVAVAMNVTTALRTSAEQFSVPLVEPIRDGWFTDPVVNFLPDGINLSLDGQQTYAARLKLELDKLGIPRMYSCEPIEGQ